MDEESAEFAIEIALGGALVHLNGEAERKVVDVRHLNLDVFIGEDVALNCMTSRQKWEIDDH